MTLQSRCLGTWLAVFCCALWSGCEGASIDTDHDSGTCTVDGDCVAGLLCYDQRICVSGSVVDTPVVLKLTPPPDSGLLSEQFAVTLTGSHGPATKLVLTPPAVVRGTVSQKGNTLARSIPGTLLANAPGLVDGADLRFDAISLATQKSDDGSALAYGYELRVQAGKTYDIAFWPQSEAIPPHYTTATWGGSLDAWDIELPAASEYLHVTGRLTAEGKGIANLRVALQDEAGRLCSTRATTDQSGAFALDVDPSAPTAVLAFEPVDGKDVLPRGRLQPAIKLSDSLLKPGPVEMGDIDVGNLEEPVNVTVHLQTQGGVAEPMALVRIQHSLLGPKSDTARFSKLYVETHGYANAQGDFSVRLPAGPAQIVVQPGPKSVSARTTWQGDVQGGTLALTCARRASVTGTVRDYAGRPVAATQVVLRRIDDPNKGRAPVGADKSLNADPTEIIADKSGAFSALADPGTYAVWALPPAGTGLARVLTRVVQVDAAANPSWQLTLPPPALLLGSVLRSDGKAVPGVVLDILAPHLAVAQGAAGAVSAVSLPGALSDGHLLGSAVSDAKGRFEALVVPTQVAP